MRDRLEEAAQEVFDTLGPGWSESIYHRALERELSERQIPFHSEGTIPVMYKGAPVGRRRPDLFIVPEVGDTIIVELKAGSNGGTAQLMQYLAMTDSDENLGEIRGGAVIRFNDELDYEFRELIDAKADFGHEKIDTFAHGDEELYRVYDQNRDVLIRADHIDGTLTISSDGAFDSDQQEFYDAAKRYLKSEIYDTTH